MFKPTRAVFSSLRELRKHTAPGVARVSQDIVVSGKGSYVNTESGRRLLDFSSGIGVLCLGHAHPKVSGAAAAQCMKVSHAQTSAMHHEPGLRLIERLLPVMPDKSLDTFFFTTTGAEAVEGALRLARQATGRANIVVMRGGYHGRTVGTMSLTTSKTMYSLGAHPLMPGVYPTAFPYWHQLGRTPDTSADELTRQALFDLSLVFAQQTSPKDTAAILIEPVLGEGGYVPVPPAYLQALRKVCDEHGMLLICDEVQTGFGRTGKYFATQYSDVRPDILVIAKGIANGFPLSGIVSRSELMKKQPAGSMGGTYAGNAVSCAAAVAVQETFAEERILDNVAARSTQLFDALSALRKKPSVAPLILDIRGQGLMVGVEFAQAKSAAIANDPFAHSNAPKQLASRIATRCLDKGMLLLTTSIFETVRFIPPLNVSEQEMTEGCKIFSEAVEEVVKEG